MNTTTEVVMSKSSDGKIKLDFPGLVLARAETIRIRMPLPAQERFEVEVTQRTWLEWVHHDYLLWLAWLSIAILLATIPQAVI